MSTEYGNFRVWLNGPELLLSRNTDMLPGLLSRFDSSRLQCTSSKYSQVLRTFENSTYFLLGTNDIHSSFKGVKISQIRITDKWEVMEAAI